MFRTLNTSQTWIVTLSAAGILLVTMGARQSIGLFVAPINAGTGIDIASIQSGTGHRAIRVEAPPNLLPVRLPTVSVPSGYFTVASPYWPWAVRSSPGRTAPWV